MTWNALCAGECGIPQASADIPFVESWVSMLEEHNFLDIYQESVNCMIPIVNSNFRQGIRSKIYSLYFRLVTKFTIDAVKNNRLMEEVRNTLVKDKENIWKDTYSPRQRTNRYRIGFKCV
jgi:hypothetical protein